MIIGHGIDLQEIDAIKRAYERNNRFAKRVLTDKEFQCFLEQKSTKRQMEFLAGRWAAKEAKSFLIFWSAIHLRLIRTT